MLPYGRGNAISRPDYDRNDEALIRTRSDTLTVTEASLRPAPPGRRRPPALLHAWHRAAAAAFLGNAERRAERHAGGLGVDLGLAAGIRDRPSRGPRRAASMACETMKLMPPISLAPAPTSVSITLATLVTSRTPDGDAVAGAIAGDRRRARCGSAHIAAAATAARSGCPFPRYRRPSAPAAPCPSPRCWPRMPRARSWPRR